MSVALVNPPLAKTPLAPWHVAHHGRLVEFGGWLMPVQYESIVAEHQAVRRGLGLFDISHMGRLKFTGPAAQTLLDSLLTRRISDLEIGQVRYSLVTNEAGGILDDVLVYRLASGTAGESDYFLLVVNASNRGKIVDWIRAHLAGPDVQFTDLTEQTAMIAVQGPAAVRVLQPLAAADLAAMKYYHATESQVCGRPAIVSRTGYTGEDGFEVTVSAVVAEAVWEAILTAGKPLGAVAAGLGARDTLRLEAAMPLYGHELSEEIDPLTAGLGFAVNLENRTFPGRDALAKIKQSPRATRRIGLELAARRVPREHYPILRSGGKLGDEPVGEVTSGTFSPTFERPIAMAYVRADLAEPDTELLVDIRGQLEPARVVKLPFYRRK
jgi:aminomethyltransferase